MIDFILPTQKNNYRAHLITKPFLIAFLLIIFLFNVSTKIDTRAENVSSTINSDNLLKKHNEVRKQKGLGELTYSENLSISAKNKALKMLESNCWSHYCPEGKSPWDFFDDAGYDYILAGENLAEGFYDIEDLMNAWINSKTHRENIEKPEFLEVGFGIVQGNYQNVTNNTIVAVHFGTRAQDAQRLDKELIITNPISGQIIKSNLIDIEGNAQGLDEVVINVNDEFIGNARIDQGYFTYRLEELIDGDYSVFAKDPSGETTSNKISLKVENVLAQVTGDIPSETEPATTNALILSSNGKNIINMAFIIALAILFLVDFVVLSRTHILNSHRGYSHYHFGIFLVTAMIIAAGGFAGSIGLGIIK